MLCLELQEYQSLLMIEKKTSLVKTQELDFSSKQITDLKGTHKHTSTVSLGIIMCVYIKYMLINMCLIRQEIYESKRREETLSET